MDTLKKLFPLSFKYSDSVANLIIGILIYLVIGVVAGLIIGFAGLLTVWIPVIGAVIAFILGLASSLAEVYIFAGIVIQILVFAKVLK